MEEGRGANLLSNLFLREFRRFVCLDLARKRGNPTLKRKENSLRMQRFSLYLQSFMVYYNQRSPYSRNELVIKEGVLYGNLLR